MQPATFAASGDRVVEGGDGDPRLHPVVDRVADDPVREDVLDRAEIQLPFAGPVLGDVGEPQLVRAPRRGELPAHQVVVGRGAGLLALTSRCLLAERTPPAVVRADPPRGPLSHGLRRRRGPRRRGTGSRTPGRRGGRRRSRWPDAPRSSSASVTGCDEPAVVGLAGELEYPARHRHGHPIPSAASSLTSG